MEYILTNFYLSNDLGCSLLICVSFSYIKFPLCDVGLCHFFKYHINNMHEKLLSGGIVMVCMKCVNMCHV